MLRVLCASAGLRLGEALGIDIKNISSDCATVKITQKAWKSQVHDFLKTDNGRREIDLHSSVAAMLKEYIGERKSGLLFCSKTGKPRGARRRAGTPPCHAAGRSSAADSRLVSFVSRAVVMVKCACPHRTIAYRSRTSRDEPLALLGSFENAADFAAQFIFWLCALSFEHVAVSRNAAATVLAQACLSMYESSGLRRRFFASARAKQLYRKGCCFSHKR